MQQLLHAPAHLNNHTLDVVITSMNQNTVSNLQVDDPLLSDHKAVTFTMDARRLPLPRTAVQYRMPRKTDIEKIKGDSRSNEYLKG